jgi:hypothetical protein
MAVIIDISEWHRWRSTSPSIGHRGQTGSLRPSIAANDPPARLEIGTEYVKDGHRYIVNDHGRPVSYLPGVERLNDR